ncbi:hypothetical protein CDL15_Pgr007161 [Punica granatum]|uniref:Uncharacterized protein n=1 Tax=Punica granatum TaxID=22663 RepID=A0A218X8T9_PUNGR|nr:hypothetical protein CDL15_Pgr007161 [Punica granatum]
MERHKSDRNRHGDRERIPSILLQMLLLEAEDEGYVAVGEGEGGSKVETVGPETETEASSAKTNIANHSDG